MEALRRWHTLHGCALLFLFITTFRKGSTCEPPSSPLCFRKLVNDSVDCQWNMNTTEHDVTYDICFNYNRTEKTFTGIKSSRRTFAEEELLLNTPAEIWVDAHAGNSSCQSSKTSVILAHTVKYDVAENITMSWLKGDLVLAWTDKVKLEAHPALAEVRFRVHHRPSEPWEYRMANTTSNKSKYQITVENLLEHTAYQFQIRYRSAWFRNPLWSDWSPVVTVPAELDQQPVVTINTKVLNGTRKILLTWEHMLHAASVTGVTYSITDTQSSHKCPCKQVQRSTGHNRFTLYVSYAAVSISVVARNAAGFSPAAVASVGQIATADLKICDRTLLGKKVKKRNCLELYEFQDGDWRPATVSSSTKRKYTNETMKNYTYYLYFEHRCSSGRPRTDEMCVFYHKEGVPLTEPQNFTVSGESSNSVNLSWEAIPIEELRGFLSHYRFCSLKINSEQKDEVCYNVSASVTEHRLVNLTPGSKYNISLAAVTGAGEGPQVIRIINTLPENMAVLLWILSVLFVMFLISTLCTCMLRQIKQKVFPPVPKPIISDFTHYQAPSQMLERPEEVDELMLYELHQESKLTPESTEETLFRGEWYEDTDEEEDEEEDEDEDEEEEEEEEEDSTDLRGLQHYGEECLNSTGPALKKSGLGARKIDLANEIAMLIYRNGLMFDVKTDSS